MPRTGQNNRTLTGPAPGLDALEPAGASSPPETAGSGSGTDSSAFRRHDRRDHAIRTRGDLTRGPRRGVVRAARRSARLRQRGAPVGPADRDAARIASERRRRSAAGAPGAPQKRHRAARAVRRGHVHDPADRRVPLCRPERGLLVRGRSGGQGPPRGHGGRRPGGDAVGDLSDPAAGDPAGRQERPPHGLCVAQASWGPAAADDDHGSLSGGRGPVRHDAELRLPGRALRSAHRDVVRQ